MMSVDFAEKIETLLGEFRIIVPGLGALFGFQLVVAFQPTFADLPLDARIVNFAGVLCTALTILMLLVPASYHRFTPDYDQTESFLNFAQRMISLAFVFLPLSLGLSVYVQAVRTFGSEPAAAAISLGLLALLAIGWWVVPIRKAKRVSSRHGR
jgi:hypothetical protein